MLPAGCDCVAAQEDTDQGTPVSVPIFLPPRQNYIRRGEDYRAGETLFPAGARIDAAAVGVLASAGISQVAVRRRPRVAVLATGDEVVPPGVHPAAAGKIYDANQALLLARLAELGFPGAAGARVGDDPERAAAAMAELLEGCDLLITTGGGVGGGQGHPAPGPPPPGGGAGVLEGPGKARLSGHVLPLAG